MGGSTSGIPSAPHESRVYLHVSYHHQLGCREIFPAVNLYFITINANVSRRLLMLYVLNLPEEKLKITFI